MKELNTPVNTVSALKLVTRNNSLLLFLFSDHSQYLLNQNKQCKRQSNASMK